MNGDRPDLATVADALAGVLTADRQAELDALLAADPAARATFARHEQALAATSRLLSSQPAPMVPRAVADSLDAAVRAAAAARGHISTTPVPLATGPVPRRSPVGRAVRRHAGDFALAAVVVGAVVLAVTQLGGSGGTVSDSSGAAGAAAGSSAATPAPAGAPAAAAGTAGAAGTASASRPGTATASGRPTSAAAAPAAPLTGPARSGSTARAGTLVSGVEVATLAAAQVPVAARALAADRTATTATCPARPGSRTLLRAVRYGGVPSWLAVTASGDTLVAEVTRSVCGPALLTRTLSAR